MDGSLTLLRNASSSAWRSMIRELDQTSDCYQQIPIWLSRDGLRMLESGDEWGESSGAWGRLAGWE